MISWDVNFDDDDDNEDAVDDGFQAIWNNTLIQCVCVLECVYVCMNMCIFILCVRASVHSSLHLTDNERYICNL